MTQAGRWIAVDWRTDRAHVALMSGATATDRRDVEHGSEGVRPNAIGPALAALAGDWLPADGAPIDILVCGPVGLPPRRAVPCPPLADTPVEMPDPDPRLRVRVVPGLTQATPHPDILQGGETRIAGLLAERPEFDGVVGLTGAHTIWAHVSVGEVVSFRTAMTGELFGLLARGTLGAALAGGGWGDADVSDAAFLDAVSDTMSRPERALSTLFELRAAEMLGTGRPGSAQARLSGLLIGAELAATRAWWLGREVALVGPPGPSEAYRVALAAQGIDANVHDGAAAALRGLVAAHRTHATTQGQDR